MHTQSRTSARWSIWLMPSESDEVLWQSRIAELAALFDGPMFRPHITLYSGVFSDTIQPQTILHQANCPWEDHPLNLTPVDLQMSPIFQKACVFTFYPHPRLNELNGYFKSLALPEGGDYVFRPHMSLLYGRVKSVKKRPVDKTINRWFEPISFSRLAIVDTSSGASSKEDVYGWQILAIS